MDKLTRWLDAYLAEHEGDEIVSISLAQRGVDAVGRHRVLAVMKRV